MVDSNEQNRQTRAPAKTHVSFNNYPKWKDKLRENCYKRIREDRTRLLWKMRLPDAEDAAFDHKDFIKSTVQEMVSDELSKIKNSVLSEHLAFSTPDHEFDDKLWEYDGMNTAYEGHCEEILLEMQRFFYEDLRMEQPREESDGCIKTWEDEEDEYLARAVYEHMHLNDEKVVKEVWCPICKHGELKENSCSIYCTICELKVGRGTEVKLEELQMRLAGAHAEHLERGCRLKPRFRMEKRFDLTALYIECHGCSTFDIVI